MHNMKISVTPWVAVRFLLFLFVMVGILLAPPAVSACTWLLLIAIPLVFWIKGSWDASLPLGDRSINRVLVVLALVVVTMRWFDW
jgi:hypothetical protein